MTSLALCLPCWLYFTASLFRINSGGECILLMMKSMLTQKRLKKIRFFTIISSLLIRRRLLRSSPWKGSLIAPVSSAVIVNLLNWEIRRSWLAWWSFNPFVGEILVESGASKTFVLFVESLIERWNEGALSPHRGSRRRVPSGPEHFELQELMFFIFPRMRHRRRRLFKHKRSRGSFSTLAI